MRKSSFILATAAAALLAGCGIGAPDYPQFSEPPYRIEGLTGDPNGGPATRTVIYRDGPKMRVEAVLPDHGPAVVVFDETTNAAYVLTQTPSTATVNPNAAPNAPGANQPSAAQPATPPATTQTPPAATVQPSIGVAVRLDDADAPQPMETVWAALGEENARSVGECQVAGEDGHEWQPRDAATGVERTACITDDGIVLRVRENDMVLWEATSVQRGDQPDEMFGVPSNYQLIDPQAVAEGVGERMEELDSVTGDGSRPTPPRG